MSAPTWFLWGIRKVRGRLRGTPGNGGLTIVTNLCLHVGHRDSTFAHSMIHPKQKQWSQQSSFPLSTSSSVKQIPHIGTEPSDLSGEPTPFSSSSCASSLLSSSWSFSFPFDLRRYSFSSKSDSSSLEYAVCGTEVSRLCLLWRLLFVILMMSSKHISAIHLHKYVHIYIHFNPVFCSSTSYFHVQRNYIN